MLRQRLISWSFCIQLVTGYRRDPEVTSLLREYDWYILPLVNPDGYSYSRTVVKIP